MYMEISYLIYFHHLINILKILDFVDKSSNKHKYNIKIYYELFCK